MDQKELTAALRALSRNAKFKKVFALLSKRSLTSGSSDAYSMNSSLSVDDIRALFVELDRLGIGTMDGRRRIIWLYDPISVGKVAIGKQDELVKVELKGFLKVRQQKAVVQDTLNSNKPPATKLSEITLEELVKEINARGFKVSLEPTDPIS